jgi:quercetin dioxygenase-like cupin family protein
MIVKSNEAQRRSFLGVDFVLLSHGPESMVTKMLYKKKDNPPLHKHSNEQSGYVISGKYNIIIDNVAYKIGPGDSYSIPRDIEHRIEII